LPSFFFQNCIILLNSIYTWCNLYKNEEIPYFEFDDKDYDESTTKKTTFLQIRVEIFEILSSIHSTKNYQNHINSKKSKALLSNMHFRIVFEELINPELYVIYEFLIIFFILFLNLFLIIYFNNNFISIENIKKMTTTDQLYLNMFY